MRYCLSLLQLLCNDLLQESALFPVTNPEADEVRIDRLATADRGGHL